LRFSDDVVYRGVSRTAKRTILIACCAADVSSIKPAVIITRNAFEDEELVMMGVTSEKVGVYHPAKAFIDQDILED
jgi:hypothetical protein